MKQMSHFSDDELVKLYEQGNNEAFEHLPNRYKDRVFTQIFLLVHNKELAEDIFQDTFIKAIVFMKQGRYTDSGKFYPWLSRIAHNLIVDQLLMLILLQHLTLQNHFHLHLQLNQSLK